MTDGRPLTPNERALVDGLLSQPFQGVETLREQAKNLVAGVTRGCTCGCGTIDLLPDREAPRSRATSPVASTGVIRDEAGAEVGGLLLFLEDGRLASLEVYSFDQPLPLPPVERVTWFLSQSLCHVDGGTDLPEALARVLDIPVMREGWDNVTERDRSRYAAWVAAARSHRSARRRARVVADRLRERRGWASQPRRTLQHLFSVPTGTTAEEAYRADHPGSSPTG